MEAAREGLAAARSRRDEARAELRRLEAECDDAEVVAPSLPAPALCVVGERAEAGVGMRALTLRARCNADRRSMAWCPR